MYVHICIRMYVLHIHIGARAYKCAYAYICVLYTYTCKYVHLVCVCAHAYICANVSYVCVCIWIYLYNIPKKANTARC